MVGLTIILRVSADAEQSGNSAHFGQMFDGFYDDPEEWIHNFIADNSGITPPGFDVELEIDG